MLGACHHIATYTIAVSIPISRIGEERGDYGLPPAASIAGQGDLAAHAAAVARFATGRAIGCANA